MNTRRFPLLALLAACAAMCFPWAAGATAPIARLDWLAGTWDCGHGSVFTYAPSANATAMVMRGNGGGSDAASFTYENGRYVYRSVVPADPYIATLPGSSALPHLVTTSYTESPADVGVSSIVVSGGDTPSGAFLPESRTHARLALERAGATLTIRVSSREKAGGAWVATPALKCGAAPLSAAALHGSPAPRSSELQTERDRCVKLLDAGAFGKAEGACSNFTSLLALNFATLKKYGEPRRGSVPFARTIPITRGLADASFLLLRAYRGNDEKVNAKETALQTAAFTVWLTDAIGHVDPQHREEASVAALSYAEGLQKTLDGWYPGIVDAARKLPKPPSD